jgi:hypothetical protein
MTTFVQGAPEIDELSRNVERQMELETRRQRHAAQRAARRSRRRTPEQRARRRLAILAPLLGMLLAANGSGIGPFAMPQRELSSQETSRRLHSGVRFGVRLVEAHRARSGALPPNLETIGLDAAGGWSYAADGGEFRLSLNLYGRRERFDSKSGRTEIEGGS